jgi:hypothetical protein
MAAELASYITDARGKNFSDEEIKDQLLEAGWSKEQITEAFAQVAGLTTPPPPPSTTPAAMWTGVLYILFFISLYVLALAISGIFHAWIDNPILKTTASGPGISNTSSYDLFAFFLQQNNYSYIGLAQTQLVQIYLSAIFISLPLFLLLGIILKKQLVKQPQIKTLRLYKILVFVTLISTFLFMIGEIITIGFAFLSGGVVGIALRHLLVTLLIAGSIFVYFFVEVKMHGKKVNKDIFAIIYIAFFAILALVYGFSIIPTPAVERARTNDHKRVIALGLIKDAIDDYYQNHSELPQSLGAVNSNIDGSGPLNKVDPETNEQYKYMVNQSASTYKLCATFSTTSSKDTDPNGYDDPNGDYSNFKDQFNHPIGYHCFSENENGDSTDDSLNSSTPTMSCVGSGCSLTPTPAPITQANPFAVLSSLDKIGACQWTPTFTLKGFAPYDDITVDSYGTLSDNCDPNKTHSYSWTAQWIQQTDANGDLTVSYTQNDYGDYTYTFSDTSGDSASVHYQNSPTTGPTIVPAGGGGGGGPRDINNSSNF